LTSETNLFKMKTMTTILCKQIKSRFVVLTGILLGLSGLVRAEFIQCDNADIARAYELAVQTVQSNVRDGILAAGAEYGGEWTRDSAINAWNGVSLLDPAVAERSLWSVTENRKVIGHQHWDHIIWVVAALNQYRTTGSREFLKESYMCSAASMLRLEFTAYDPNTGLFRGPSVFNDGIAGYPEPIYDKTNVSSYVLDHPNSANIKCLSTNSLYVGAYRALAQMARMLGDDSARIALYEDKAQRLSVQIQKHLWQKKENRLNYLVDHRGVVVPSQEGLGISFAVIFDVLNNQQAAAVVSNASVSKFGIVSIYPDFAQFSADKPGRHNNLIWPMVNGFFAKAAITTGQTGPFMHELEGLTRLALDADKGNNEFWEIYNPQTGKPDGGWQTGSQWKSCRRQTWSATAYINMVQFGLAGLRMENDGISFSPYMPQQASSLKLSGLTYRGFPLSIAVSGTGNTVKSFTVNGKTRPKARLDAAEVQAATVIVIEVK
jgi:hypothetical protein